MSDETAIPRGEHEVARRRAESDETLRTYFSVTTKIAAVEVERDADELVSNPEYQIEDGFAVAIWNESDCGNGAGAV